LRDHPAAADRPLEHHIQPLWNDLAVRRSHLSGDDAVFRFDRLPVFHARRHRLDTIDIELLHDTVGPGLERCRSHVAENRRVAQTRRLEEVDECLAFLRVAAAAGAAQRGNEQPHEPRTHAIPRLRLPSLQVER